MTGVVYQILNLKNNKKYIGATKAIGNRMQQHLTRCFTSSELPELYKDMSEDITAFSFSILEYNIPNKNLFERENYWIEKLNTKVDGYNGIDMSSVRKLTLEQVIEVKRLLTNTIYGIPCISKLMKAHTV